MAIESRQELVLPEERAWEKEDYLVIVWGDKFKYREVSHAHGKAELVEKCRKGWGDIAWYSALGQYPRYSAFLVVEQLSFDFTNDGLEYKLISVPEDVDELLKSAAEYYRPEFKRTREEAEDAMHRSARE